MYVTSRLFTIVGLSNSVIYLISVVNYCSIEDENNLQEIIASIINILAAVL